MATRSRVVWALLLVVSALGVAGAGRAQDREAPVEPVPEGPADPEDALAELRADVEALQVTVDGQATELAGLRRELADALAPDVAGSEVEDAEDGGGILATRQPIGRFPDDAIVRTGEFDRSVVIPGTDLSFRIGGLVRLELAFDPDSVGFDALVSSATIPLDGSVEDGRQQIHFSARDSRINFEIRHVDDHTIFRTFIEADFFGPGDELLSGYGFRLRHAIAQIGPFIAGQWWSAFVDTRTFPENSSFGGPLGAPTARQPSLRLTDVFGAEDRWRWVVSVENPVVDLTDPDERVREVERVPDVLAALAMDYPNLRLRLAGLGRVLESETDAAVAGGVNLSGRVQLPFLSEHGDNLAFQGQIGTGIGRYYVGFTGTGIDGAVGDNGAVDPLFTFGGYIAYQHWWSDRIRSTITASYQRFDPPDPVTFLPFREGGYYAINLFWTPTDGATFGLDVIYATRRTSLGEFGSGVRTHASARFDF